MRALRRKSRGFSRAAMLLPRRLIKSATVNPKVVEKKRKNNRVLALIGALSAKPGYFLIQRAEPNHTRAYRFPPQLACTRARACDYP